MNNQLAYSGITTKVHAMEGSLITYKMYEEISYLSSVSEFVSYLKQNTPYSSLFENMEDSSLHRGQIERILTAGVYQDFVKLYRFADASQREYLSCYFRTFEITIIKKCLRSVRTGIKEAYMPSMYDSFFIKHSKLNIPQMYAAGTREELLAAISNSEYYSLFTRNDFQGTMDDFHYELLLDQYYFSSMWKSIHKTLSPSMLDCLEKLYGTKIDMLNIQWLYRARFNYNLTDNQLSDVLIPVSYKVNAQELNALMHAETPDEFNAICQSCYPFRKYHIKDMAQLDREYNSIIHSICAKEAKKDPYSIAVIYSHIINKEFERKNLTRTLECIRYRLEPAKILEYIKGGFKS